MGWGEEPEEKKERKRRRKGSRGEAGRSTRVCPAGRCITLKLSRIKNSPGSEFSRDL